MHRKLHVKGTAAVAAALEVGQQFGQGFFCGSLSSVASANTNRWETAHRWSPVCSNSSVCLRQFRSIPTEYLRCDMDPQESKPVSLTRFAQVLLRSRPGEVVSGCPPAGCKSVSWMPPAGALPHETRFEMLQKHMILVTRQHGLKNHHHQDTTQANKVWSCEFLAAVGTV